MKKLLTFLLTLSMAQVVFAQDAQSEASKKTLLQELKDSPFSFTLDNYFYAQRTATANYLGDAMLNYKLTDQDSFRILGEFESQQLGREESNAFTFTVAEARYKRSGILEEEKQFVNLSAELRAGYFVSDKVRNPLAADGYVSGRLNVAKTVGIWSPTLIIRHDQRIRKNSLDGTTKYRHRWYLVNDFAVADKITIGNYFFYNRETKVDDTKTSYSFGNVSVNYEINDMFTVGVYTEGKLTIRNEARSSRDILKENQYGLNVVASVF